MSDTQRSLTSELTRPHGEILARFWDADTGLTLTPDEARVHVRSPGIPSEEVNGQSYLVIGENLVVNKGRQTIANLIGGRDYDPVTPNSDWIVKYVRFGTYDQAPKFGDLTLSPQPQAGVYTGGENTIALDAVAGVPTNAKLISAVDWPQEFVVRFEIVLGPDEANGSLVREMGLFTGNDTLFARKTFVGIAKSASFGVSFLWRIRC